MSSSWATVADQASLESACRAGVGEPEADPESRAAGVGPAPAEASDSP